MTALLCRGRVSPVKVYQFCSVKGGGFLSTSSAWAKVLELCSKSILNNQEPRDTAKPYYSAKLTSEIYWKGKTQERRCLCWGRRGRELSRRQGLYRISWGRGISRLVIGGI